MSLDDMSDIMGDNFNTLKKNNHITIEPPLEFQDKPYVINKLLLTKYTNELAFRIIRDAIYAVTNKLVNVDDKNK